MKEIINSNKAPKALGAYSQAIRAGGFIFTSGQIGLRADGEFAGADIKAQTKQAMQNLEAVLNQAGASFKEVIKTNIFLKDINDFSIVNEIYASFFDDNTCGCAYPARSALGVANLPKGALVEIEMIAFKA